MDETGITIIKTKFLLHKEDTRTITMTECGILLAALIWMSAAGHKVSSFIILLLHKMKAEVRDDAPRGTVFSYT